MPSILNEYIPLYADDDDDDDDVDPGGKCSLSLTY
jgi:hypothetical protein